MGLEHGLGGTELTSGGSLGVRELLLHTGKDLLLVGGGLVEGDVKLLGRLGEVLGEGAHVTGLAVTSLGESGVRGLRESGDLLLGGGLVLVHELAEHATGTDVGGVASVGDLDDLVALGLDLTVDADLVGLVGDDHGGHNLDVATKASLLLLDLGGQSNDLGGEVLMGVLDILGGGDAGSLDVLDGGRETRVGKGRLLGELVVEVGNGSTHVPVHGLDDLGVTGSRGGVHSRELNNSGLAGSLELGVDGRSVGLHLCSDDAGVLGHLLGMSGDVAVGLLDLLGGLFLEAKEGTLLGGNGITDLVDDVLLVVSNAGAESGTGGTTLLLLGAEALVEGSELGLGPSDLLLQVSLGDSRGRLDGVKHLLAHLGAGGSSLQVELVNLGVDVLRQSANLGGHTVVKRGTGLLVDRLHLLLNLKSTLLSLVDGIADGRLELGLVELRDGTETGTASGILDVVLHNNTSELLDASIVLALEVTDGLVETSNTSGEAPLGVTESSLGIHLSTAGGRSKSMVGSLLGSLVLSEDAVQTSGLRSEATLGMSTVALHLLADGSNLLEEAVGKLLHATGSRGLVTGREAAEFLVLLKVLLVASITDLHHALELSRHLTVDLGLFELVVCTTPESWVTRLLSLADCSCTTPDSCRIETLKSRRNLDTRAFASFFAAAMSETVLAKRRSWRALLAFSAASIRAEACLSAISA